MNVPRYALDKNVPKIPSSTNEMKKTEELDYVWDPEHKKRPEGSNWKQTDKGWSKAKKPQKQKESPKPKRDNVKENVRTEVEDKTKEAAKTVEEYYGKIDDGEKKKIDEETQLLLRDYIEKAAKGLPATLPELSHESKIKFLQALFITVRAKQIESIPVQDKTLKENQTKIVNDLYNHANRALEEVVSDINTRSIIQKNIRPNTVQGMLPKSSKKDISKQSDTEFSDTLALSNEKDYISAFRRKPSMRALVFKDLPQSEQEKADRLAYDNKLYGENFSRLNWSIKDIVKYHPNKNRNSFIIDGYVKNPDSVVSDISIPISEASSDKMVKSMNSLMKKLVGLGFKGIVETGKNAEDIAMNKGMLTVTTDNPKHALAVNDIIKETFAENGIQASSSIHKKQFGMDEENLFDYSTRLKKVIPKDGSGFKLPLNDLPKYMAAARYNGVDLIVEKGGNFNLVPHNPLSEVGKMKLDGMSKQHPKELIAELYFANKKDKLPKEELPSINIEDPFKDIREKLPKTEEEPDYSILDERKTEPETVSEKKTEPTPSFNGEEIEDNVKSIGDKAVQKDLTVFNDIKKTLQGMLEDISSSRNVRLYPQYKKAIGRIALGLLKGEINDKTPPEVTDLFKKVEDSIKEYQAPALPKTTKAFNFEAMPNYKKIAEDVDSEEISDISSRNTGWRYTEQSGKPMIVSKTANGTHGLEFDTKEEAKAWARKNPYVGDKFRVDSVEDYDSEFEKDTDMNSGKRLSKSLNPDASKVREVLNHYNIKEGDDRLKYILGYKRYLLHKASDEEKNEIYSEGLKNWLGKKSATELKSDFLNHLSTSDPERSDGLKTSMNEINPEDFVKLVNGIAVLSPETKKSSIQERFMRISDIVFNTYESPDGLKPIQKLPVIVEGMKVDEPFRVKSLEGDYAQGKPGDFLIHGIEGENYICDKEIFHKTYKEISESAETSRRA